MGIIPECVDSVTIGDIERTRLPEIKALFIVGVNEGVLPSSDTDVKGILSERERIKMENAGAELSHSGARLAFEEQYLIYMGITKPSEYLYICRNRTDSSGRQTRPSSVITRFENIFGNIEHEEHNYKSLKVIDRPIPVLHKLGEHMTEGRYESVLWKETAQWLIDNNRYKNRAIMLESGAEFDNNEKNLSKKNIDMLLGENIRTSVSRLETYSACPFYYYSRYSLKAKPRKIFEIQTPDLGSLFHSVLERFTQTMKERGLSWKTVSEAEAKEITESAIDELAPNIGNRVLLSTAAHSYLIKRIKRVTKRAVSVLRRHMQHGQFETIGCEVGFGFEDGDLPPIEITMPDKRNIVLSGKIDRVDMYSVDGNSYIKIIDYKSGKKEFSLSNIYYGLQLQLLLYMDAFIKTGKVITIDEPQVGGVFYFRVMDPVIKSSELNGTDPEQALFKQFCMSGLVCDEEEVIRALDDTFNNTEGKMGSEIINVSRNRDGIITGSAVSRYKYDKLMEFAMNKAEKIGEGIADGDVSIKPVVNKGSSPCDYCEYVSVCCFDSRTGNLKNKLQNLSSNDVWEKILSGNNNSI
ncbi:ATP-dependent helicase/deoxyribonuclease subunit B [bioreactor metagenome]|uniref:ATP-dependent helicase/deoxyribonuclease subunit B n=1 Tax=bioreactor metagenome TaxID=1076179 RepID=A0A645AWL5_9ZZZZ